MNILEMDLNEDQEMELRETLESFKEEVYSNMLEEVEELKEAKLQELEEANEQWRAEVKKDYTDKMLEALTEMREEIQAEVTAELLESNPELAVLEKIKEIIAPTLSDDYTNNLYAEEVVTLKSKLDKFEEEKKLEEGAKTLADLIRPYSEKTQNILISVIQEGGPEEVTEQFYKILEGIEDLEEEGDDVDVDVDVDDDDEDDDDDEKDKDKKKKGKKKKGKKKKDDEDEDDEDEDDDKEKDDDDDVEEDFEGFETYIKENDKEEEKKVNPLLSRINDLAK